MTSSHQVGDARDHAVQGPVRNSNIDNGSGCANIAAEQGRGRPSRGRDRQHGPQVNREQLDERRGERRREGGAVAAGWPGGGMAGTTTIADDKLWEGGSLAAGGGRGGHALP